MTTSPRGAAPLPQMAHEQLPDETPTTAVASPPVVRSSRLRMWALFASGIATAGAVMLAAAPAAAPAPADPPPPCSAAGANCNDVQVLKPPDNPTVARDNPSLTSAPATDGPGFTVTHPFVPDPGPVPWGYPPGYGPCGPNDPAMGQGC
jgi:hypothetical protein